MWLILLLSLFHTAAVYDVDPEKMKGLAKARVETCGGWQLNRLREVKAFVVQDIPLYHNLVMKHIPGADPELVLLNHYYEELDRIPLSDMTRPEINELLDKLGFYKKEHTDHEVPEEFKFSPAKDSPFPDEPPFKSAVASKPEAPEHTDL